MLDTNSLINYYAGLLILQYVGKPKAYATIQALVNPVVMPQVSVQTITFALAPTSGTFVLSYNSIDTAAINWNDSASTIQTKLQGVTGLGSVTVSGSIAGLTLTITFTGVTPPALYLVLGANSLVSSGTAVIPAVTETDITLPIAIQDAFNLTGSNLAVGPQLDVLAKYVGVTRVGYGFRGQVITLSDADLITFIRMGILTTSGQSDAASIQSLLNIFFPGEVYMFENGIMRMSYLILSTVGSQDLVQLWVTEKLLPKPMGVQLSVVTYTPTIIFFGFRTYVLGPSPLTYPFNSYSSYLLTRPWLTYADGIV